MHTAFDLGFGSVDGFTRAFNREFGMCPSDYAANPVPITLFVPYGAKFRALRKDQNDMKKTNNIFIQVIRKPERKVLCKRGVKAEDYFPYCEEAPFRAERVYRRRREQAGNMRRRAGNVVRR